MGHIQQSFIYDDNGQPIGVVLPYGEWLDLQGKKVQLPENQTSHVFRAGDLKRTLAWEVNPVEFQRQAREE